MSTWGRVVTYFSGFELLTIFAKKFLFTKDPILDTWESSEYASVYIGLRQPIFIMSYLFQLYSFVVFLSAIIQNFNLIQKGVTIILILSNSAETNCASSESKVRRTGIFQKKVQKRAFYPIAAFTYLVLGKS